MSLSRFNPFVFPSVFEDDFFEPPATFFPRDLTSYSPRTVGEGESSQKAFYRHPGYEVHEDDKNYMLSIDVPGVRPEDMKIDVEDNMLHVKGGRKIRKDGGFSESKFDYRVSMGENIDLQNLAANLDHGVLSLSAPKVVHEKPKSRSIQINSGPSPMQIGNVEKKTD